MGCKCNFFSFENGNGQRLYSNIVSVPFATAVIELWTLFLLVLGIGRMNRMRWQLRFQRVRSWLMDDCCVFFSLLNADRGFSSSTLRVFSLVLNVKLNSVHLNWNLCSRSWVAIGRIFVSLLWILFVVVFLPEQQKICVSKKRWEAILIDEQWPMKSNWWTIANESSRMHFNNGPAAGRELRMKNVEYDDDFRRLLLHATKYGLWRRWQFMRRNATIISFHEMLHQNKNRRPVNWDVVNSV